MDMRDLYNDESSRLERLVTPHNRRYVLMRFENCVPQLWRAAFCAILWASVMLSGCNCENTGEIGNPPKLKINPPSLVFEAVQVGGTLNKSVVLSNEGGEDLTITELKIVNETAGVSFTLLTQKDLPLKIPTREEVKLTIRYSPKRAGSARGHVRIVSDAINPTDTKDGISFTKVSLRTTQLNADITVDPNPLDFGTVKPGQENVKSFVIKNRGQANLRIDGMEFKSNVSKEFELKTPLSYPKDIPPNKDLTVDVAYNPNKNVADEILIIRNNAKGSENFELRLVGQRAAPDIEVTPKELKYDDVYLGTKGTKTFTIKNKGTEVLEVKRISFDANTSKDFDFDPAPQATYSIEPGKSVDIGVSYDSKDVNDDSGSVTIESNDPDSPIVKVLLSAKAKGCDLKAIPDNLYFTKPDKKTFNLINKGNLPCTFKGATFSATTSKEFGFSKPPAPAQLINPGQFIEFEVEFKPTDGTPDLGAIEIAASGQGRDKIELMVKLESKLVAAQACQIKASPTNINYGFVGVGRSKQLPVTIENNGYGNCQITQATFNPNPNNAFVLISQIPTNGLIVPSNAKVDITIAYTPPAAGTHVGKLELLSNDPKTPMLAISLNGSAGVLCLEALPDPMDFSSVKVNCSSQQETMEIFNICNKAAQITNIKFSANTNRGVQEFFIKALPTLPRTVNFGQSLTAKLSYVPRNLGVDLGSLEIENNLPGQSPISITLRGEGVNTDTQKDVFKQLNKPAIDILFVVDNSCSMGDDQNSLASNSQSFIQWAAQLQVNYQIGVTTTDIASKGCLRGSGANKIITPNTPNITTVFRQNAVAGTSGSASERGLETSYMALSAPSVTGCNNGFYRTTASLSIIYLTDEPDYSTKQVGFYINFFKNLKGFRNPDKIRVSAIGYSTQQACSTSGTCRYYEVVKALRGIYENIKSANWGQTLSQLGAVTFGYRTQFFLSRPADRTTIRVKVNGVVVNESATAGWSYDATSNSINFAKSAVPNANALIEITYKAICLAP